MAARVPIYPLFIVRLGRRSYRLVVGAPFDVQRHARSRRGHSSRRSRSGRASWSASCATAWFQWFAFEPFAEEDAA